MTEPMPRKLLTVQDVADLLGLKRGTIEKWVQAGTIPHIRLSHCCVRFRKEAIEEWLAAKTIEPKRKPLSLVRAEGR